MGSPAPLFPIEALASLRNTPSPAIYSDLDLGFLSSIVDDLAPISADTLTDQLPLAATSISFAQPSRHIDTSFQLPQEDLAGIPLASFQPEFVQQNIQRNPQLHRPSLQAAAQHGRSSSRSSNESPPEGPSAFLDGLPKLEGTFDCLYDSQLAAELSGQDIDISGDMEKARAKNRNAQKKFRARQKERMKDSQRQLEELSKKMAKLAQEKAELQSRNRILEHVVRLNVDHVEELSSNQEVCRIEQEMLVTEFWHWYVRAGQRNLSLEAIKAMSIDDYATKYFPAYIMRLRDLLKQGPHDAAAARELRHMVLIRRDQENRAALFSFWNGAILGYNLHKGEGMAPPPHAQWVHVLAQIELTEMQQHKMVEARRRVLMRLKGIAEKRRQIVSSLGLELLSCNREQLHSCKAARSLRENLNEEREAVFDFLFTVGDEVLSPRQEALMDIHSLPWWPDVWQMSALLARAQKVSMPEEHTLGELTSSSPALISLMPSLTAYQALTRPMLALGMGFQLKRGIVMCPFRTSSPAVAFPIPALQKVGTMGLMDVMCGKYRPHSFAEWLQEYQRLVAFAENEENPALAYRAIVFSDLSIQPKDKSEEVAESKTTPSPTPIEV